MAFRSNNPISLVFPPVRGITRRIILTTLCVYFGLALLALFSKDLAGTLSTLMVLRADQALHPLVWELATYPFFGQGLLSVAFALLSVWFFGSALEDDRGSLWFSEYFFTSTIVGAITATLISDDGLRLRGCGRKCWRSSLPMAGSTPKNRFSSTSFSLSKRSISRRFISCSMWGLRSLEETRLPLS
jgi:membrane associated rhomboid family serine protease